MTLRIMFVTRNVVSGRATDFGVPTWTARSRPPLTSRWIATSGRSVPALGKSVYADGNLQGRGFEDAERDRWIRPRRSAGADLAPERRDVVVPGGFRHFHGHDVAGQGERTPQRDGAFELAVVVARAPFLIVEREGRRLRPA